MPISFPFEKYPPPGTALEVAAGVYWVRMPLPFALDHVNLWLIRDTAGWTVVDTGIALDETKSLWRQLLPSYPLQRQIVTHGHPDHIGLAGWLQAETAAPLWITQGEYLTSQLLYAQLGGLSQAAMIELFRRHGLDADRLQALAERARTSSYRHKLSEPPATFTRLLDGQNLAIGGHAWRVLVGYGHSPEHAALYCADLNLLISGDMLLPRISTNVSVWAINPDENPLRLFLDSIEDFKQCPDDTLVLPSHGRPFRGIRQRIGELAAHHEERCRALLGALDRARSAADLMPVLFERELDDPHQVMFAMGEALAHLNFLEQRQQIERIDANEMIRFVKRQL